MVSIVGLDDRGRFLSFSLFCVAAAAANLDRPHKQLSESEWLLSSFPGHPAALHHPTTTFLMISTTFFQAVAQSDASLAQRDNLCHCYWALPDSDQWDIQSLWSCAITQITTFSAMCNAIVAMWQCYNGTHKILFQ